MNHEKFWLFKINRDFARKRVALHEKSLRCKESRDFARLFKVLAPEGYEDLPANDKKEVKKEVILKIYNYINWMFDYKFRRGDKSVTGTQIFLLPSMINEFERMYSDYMIKNGQNLLNFKKNHCQTQNAKLLDGCLATNAWAALEPPLSDKCLSRSMSQNCYGT